MTLHEAIRIARKALAENFELAIMSQDGKSAMVALDKEHADKAEAYNVLARFHPRAARIDAEA